VHSILGEAVACGAFLKYMSEPSYSSYIRSPLLIPFIIIHIKEEEGLHTFH
jgi:hypothetical protein